MEQRELWEDLDQEELKSLNGGAKEWLFAFSGVLGIPLVLGIYIGYNQNI